MDNNTQKKSRKLPVIIAVVLVISALAAAGFFFVPRLLDMFGNNQIGDVDEAGADKDDEDEDGADEDEADEDEADEDEADEDGKIAAIISRAEKLAAGNRLERALEWIREGLKSYPNSKELQEKAEEYALALEEQTRGTEVLMERVWDSGSESAVFTGINAQGNIVWTYETRAYPQMQLDTINEIGAYGENYYLVENGSILVLHIADGSVLWVNDDFNGSASGWAFDDEGTLYLCGHLGPDLFIVDADGNTVHRRYSFNSEYLWPYRIAYQETQIAITFDEVPPGADHVIYVGLSDFSVLDTDGATGPETPLVSTDNILAVTATSYLEEPQYGFVHGPSNVIDGELSTAWVEDADGQGVNESITIQLDGIYQLSGFVIFAGYQKSADTYWNNSRPKILRATFSDGTGMDISLEDVNEQQTVTFDTPVDTSSVTFTIQSVYPGNRYQDTAISEISLF